MGWRGMGLAIVCLVLGAETATALDLNGFIAGKGQGTVALSYTTESYDEFWVGEAKVSDPGVGEVETETLSLWVRYGLTERVSLVANVPHVDVSSDGLGGFGDSGLQDLSALVAFRALEGGQGPVRHRLIAAGGVRTPLSSYEPNRPVDLGDGTTDWLLRVVYQLEAGGFYASQQVGYDLRNEDAPDGFALYTEAGYTWGRVTVNGFYLDYSADGGTDIGDPDFTFPSNQDETERIGAKVFARFTDTYGAFVGAFQTLDGRNSGDTSGISVGMTFGF